MKRAIVSLLLLLLSFSMNAQEITVPTLSKEAYLKKSKTQKVIGWVLLGGGIGLFVGAIKNYEMHFNFGGPNTTDNTTSTLYGIAGTGAIVGSIISFHSARNNKRKAVSVTIKTQELLLPVKSTVFMKRQQAISLSIALR